MTTDATRVALARRWFRLRGHDPIHATGSTVVRTPAHPATWDLNFVLPAPDAAPADVIAAVEQHFPAPVWQVVSVDALTANTLLAALGLANFTPSEYLIEMLATRPIGSPHALARIATRPIATTADRAALDALVAADRGEGRATSATDPDVAAGLNAAIERRLPWCDYRIIAVDGVDVGYGLSVVCPEGLGLIEQLFTLPAWRGRGIMSAFIVEAAARLSSAGCHGIFLDAYPADTAKHLYARLGFAPIGLTATWTRPHAD